MRFPNALFAVHCDQQHEGAAQLTEQQLLCHQHIGPPPTVRPVAAFPVGIHSVRPAGRRDSGVVLQLHCVHRQFSWTSTSHSDHFPFPQCFPLIFWWSLAPSFDTVSTLSFRTLTPDRSLSDTPPRLSPTVGSDFPDTLPVLDEEQFPESFNIPHPPPLHTAPSSGSATDSASKGDDDEQPVPDDPEEAAFLEQLAEMGLDGNSVR